MKAVDGKMRLTDVADTEQIFRLIQFEMVVYSNKFLCLFQ